MALTVRRRVIASVAVAALVAAGFGLSESIPPGHAQALPKTPIEAPEHPPGSFANVVDKVKPGVVAVKVKLDSGLDDDDGPNMQEVPPQLREFFRRFGQGGGQGAPVDAACRSGVESVPASSSRRMAAR